MMSVEGWPQVADAWVTPVAGEGVRASRLPLERSLAEVGFAEAFRSGVQMLPAADEPAKITVHALGEVVVASGRLAGTDPIAPLRVDVLDADLAPGRYPVFLSICDGRAVAVLVRFAAATPVRWEDASAVDVEPGWATVEVDSGTVALMEAELAAALQAEREGFGPFFPVPGGISERMYDAIIGRTAAVVEHEGLNAMVVHVGDDYPYPVAWGYGEKGQVVAAVIDCCELALCTRPWEPDDADEEWT